MTGQTIERRPAVDPSVHDDAITITEIEYLIDTRRIDHIILAGVPMISLDGLRAYLHRHRAIETEDPESQLQLIAAD